jgi:formylglycine-generating enzyme required for sulfatase activity
VADGTGGYGYNENYDPAQSISGDAFEGRDPKYSWRDPGFVQGDNHPVVNVTWNDAVALAKWLSEKEGVKYRLPNGGGMGIYLPRRNEYTLYKWG